MSLFSWFNFTRTKTRAATAAKPATRSYRAVEVVPGEHASCKAARSLAGKRFLPEEAPLFPVAGCDQKKCECTYQRHPDRRAAARRVSDLGIAVSGRMRPRHEERRRVTSRGRRATDQSFGAM